MTTWADVYDALEQIRHLENGPGSMCVDVARCMADYFQREGYQEPTRVHVGYTNTIWFEWSIGNDYFEVEISPADQPAPESVGPLPWVVVVTYPIVDGWQERESAIRGVIGRAHDRGFADNGVREIWYYCDSLGAGREMRGAILKVGGVTSCTVREP